MHFTCFWLFWLFFVNQKLINIFKFTRTLTSCTSWLLLSLESFPFISFELFLIASISQRVPIFYVRIIFFLLILIYWLNKHLINIYI